MLAMANLAKFNGCYDNWQKIVKQHRLKWRQTDEDRFELYEKENITEMLTYINEIIRAQRIDHANTFIVATLTGLRSDEVCQAIKLIKQGTKNYYQPEYGGVLEHFRYKQIFVRRSKKALISLVNNDILKLAKCSCDSWQAIRSRLKRQNIDMHMSYCRKVFATYLRKNGIETELIDLLQGRTPVSVFAKHYYRPDFKYEFSKIRNCIARLIHGIK
jgi:intergrase/recombinase